MFLLPISGNRTPIALGAGEWVGRGGRFSPDGGYWPSARTGRVIASVKRSGYLWRTPRLPRSKRMSACPQRSREPCATPSGCGRLEAARARVSAAEERAVRYLRKTMKLGHRDAGSILGLSHQRVHQLEKKKAG